MAATTLLKNSPQMIEWIPQDDPSREASTVKKIDERLLML